MTRQNPFVFGTDLWDPSNRFETSWLLPPWLLALFRGLLVSLLPLYPSSNLSCKIHLALTAIAGFLRLRHSLLRHRLAMHPRGSRRLYRCRPDLFLLHLPHILGPRILLPRCRHTHRHLCDSQPPAARPLPSASTGSPFAILHDRCYVPVPRDHCILGRAVFRVVVHTRV
jgi:hypothetical protein